MSSFFAPSLFKLTSVSTVLPMNVVLGVDVQSGSVTATDFNDDSSSTGSAPPSTKFGSVELDFTGVTSFRWHATFQLISSSRTLIFQLWDATNSIELGTATTSAVAIVTMSGVTTVGLPTGPVLVQIRYKALANTLSMRNFRDGVNLTLS